MVSLKVLLGIFGLVVGVANGFISPQQTKRIVQNRIVTSTTVPPNEIVVPLLSSASDDPELPYGEISRRFRRSFFTHSDWLKARADDRFYKNLYTIFSSGVVRQLAKEVALVGAISTFIIFFNGLFVNGFDDLAGVHSDAALKGLGLPQLVLPLQPFTLASPSLGLLLVFRTNASYARWDEARKAWGVVVNHSRNLCRMIPAWVTKEAEPDPEKRAAAIKKLTDRVWAYARSQQRHLLSDAEDAEAFAKDVRARVPDIAEGLITARHRPTRATFELSKAVNELPMNYLRKIEVDKSIVIFCDAMGACDRIFTSPIPLMYTRHTARFLGIWMLALPFALYKAFEASWNHWLMVPVACVIAFFLFGIEELAIQLEEPFSILPLDNIVGGIGKSADEGLAWHFENDEKEQEALAAYQQQAALEAFQAQYQSNGKSPTPQQQVSSGYSTLGSFGSAELNSADTAADNYFGEPN